MNTRLILPNGVGAPSPGVKVAAEILSLLVIRPVEPDLHFCRISEPIEREYKLAMRLTAPCNDFHCPFVASGNWLIANKTIDSFPPRDLRVQNLHHAFYVRQLSHLIQRKSPGGACLVKQGLPSMVRILIEVARFKATVCVKQRLIECLIAANNMLLIGCWEGREVVVAQLRGRNEVRIKGERDAFQTRNNTETAIDWTSSRSKAHVILAALLVEPLIKSAHNF